MMTLSLIGKPSVGKCNQLQSYGHFPYGGLSPIPLVLGFLRFPYGWPALDGGGGVSVGTVVLASAVARYKHGWGSSLTLLHQLHKFKHCKPIRKYIYLISIAKTSSGCWNLGAYKPAMLGHKCLFLRQILIGWCRQWDKM